MTGLPVKHYRQTRAIDSAREPDNKDGDIRCDSLGVRRWQHPLRVEEIERCHLRACEH